MPLDRFGRRSSLVVLCTSLVIVSVVFGVRASYTRGVYGAIAAVQFTVVCVAACKLGASAIRAGSEQRRKLAVAGGLLILPFALFSFLPGIGRPGLGQTTAESHLRYLILLINAIAVAGGLVVLREALSQAGERFHSTLGFAAILLATPLYLVWATIVLAVYASKDLVSSVPVPAWANFLMVMADILLFFGGALTYLATAAFAASLGRTQWLGRCATRACVIASALALLCLAIRGLEFPDPTEVFKHAYSIPGWIVGIPAVPWMMPCVFGVVLLRRAGDEHLSDRPA